MEFLANHLDAIITLIVGIVTGGAVVKLKTNKDSNKSNQYDNISTGGGDFAGRDMRKNV